MNSIFIEGEIHYFISVLLVSIKTPNYYLTLDNGSFLNNENWIKFNLFQILVLVTPENEDFENDFCERVASAPHFTILFPNETILELFSMNEITKQTKLRYSIENSIKRIILTENFSLTIPLFYRESWIMDHVLKPEPYYY